MAMTKVKNLQLWCKKMAEGYRDVEVTNMASSWKSGLAFCAIIHRFRPDLIDYDSLSKENVFENNNLAFEVAEKELSIPAFLEAEDMVAIRVPDKLSVVTYVSQYYNYFHNKPQLGGPGVNKFVSPSKRKDNKPAALSPAQSKTSLTPSQKKDGNTAEKKNRQESIGDKCTICHEKVYLMERHIENAKLYHRRCFRNSELSPQSKVFKRQPYSPIPETKESQTSKFRKLTSDTKKDTSEKFEPSKPDFLKKNTESINVGDDLYKRDRKFDDATSKSQATVSNFLSSRMADKNKDVFPDRTSAATKTNLNTRFGTTATPASDTKPKTVDYVNKFKELDNRNLKALNEPSITKSSDYHKMPENLNESAKQHPVPKRRQNIGKTLETMDTSESSDVRPSPVPRKHATPFSTGVTSKNDDIKSKQETKGTDFSRPKTPPNSQHSEFSLNVGKTKEQSPPPPLPASSPPKAPTSQTPTDHTVQPTKLNFGGSPTNSPRQHKKMSPFNSPFNTPSNSPRDTNKFNKTEAKEPVRPHLAPAKPPRAVSEIIERSASPMDTNEGAVLSKAVVHEPSTAQSAVLVVPKRHTPHEEENDSQVLGGLLKSLAGVRKKNDANTSSISNEGKGLTSTSGAFSSNKTDFKVDLKKKDDNTFGLNKTTEKVDLRSKDKSEGNKFGNIHSKPRPKTSFVSQSRDLFSDTSTKSKDESRGKTKTVTTTKTVITTTTKTIDKKSNDTEKVVEKSKVTTSTGNNLITTDEDIPEWKRKLEERKRERTRPKSADLLSDNTAKPAESSSGMLDWQKEAEKRKEERKGGYVDPEKVPRAANRNASNFNDNNNESSQFSRPLSPPQPRPMSPPHKHTNGFTQDSNKLERSKSPDRSKDQSKPKPQDSKFPALKPVEGNKKKILFENSTVTGDKSQADVSKKKIGLGQKFVFDDVELKPMPKKPPRPAEPPGSPTSSTKSPPSRPPPPKTSPVSVTKHHVTTYQIQRQLRLIDERLTELELKGRTLEDTIRNANEDEEDRLMISWFELINDKNDLVRKECDLVYISKQQELEIEQEKIEQQLRNLVDKPARLRTEADDEEEQELLEKKVELVYQRNSIIDSIDEDRLRYLAEDADIEAMLESKGFLKEGKDGKMHKKKEKHVK